MSIYIDFFRYISIDYEKFLNERNLRFENIDINKM